MNNRFGDSRQRFSIRKFTVGVASVLLSSAVFGVSTAKADQAEEPKGQPATSVLEEASESDGGGQRTSTSASSQEVTAEPTVQAESTSAISVTAVSSEVALQEQTVASSEQKSTSQDKTSEGLSEKPVTVNETREASASDLAAANNTSSASSDNFGLKVTNLSRPIPADVKVTKTGTEITVQNPDVEMEFPNGNSKYATSKVVYHNIPFPDDMTINEGDQVIFNLPEQLRFRTSYDINVYNPDNQIVGLAQIDPEKNRVTTTFNNYFQTHPNNKLMSLELDTLYSEEVDEGEHLTLDFEGRIIHVSVGKVQSPPPGQEVISKWGSQDKHDPTILNWQMRLNYSRRLLNNLKLVDTWSDNQRFVDGSLQLRYIDSADPWIDKGSAMDLVKSISKSEHGFTIKMDRLDHMIYVNYKTKLINAVKDSVNPTNKIELKAEDSGAVSYSYVQLVGGRGDASGENKPVWEIPNDAPKYEKPSIDLNDIPLMPPAPVLDKPEWTGGTTPFDAPQLDKPEWQGGVVPFDAPVLDKPEINIEDIPLLPPAPILEKPELVIDIPDPKRDEPKPQPKEDKPNTPAPKTNEDPKVEEVKIVKSREKSSENHAKNGSEETVEAYSAPAVLPATGSDLGLSLVALGISVATLVFVLKKNKN